MITLILYRFIQSLQYRTSYAVMLEPNVSCIRLQNDFYLHPRSCHFCWRDNSILGHTLIHCTPRYSNALFILLLTIPFYNPSTILPQAMCVLLTMTRTMRGTIRAVCYTESCCQEGQIRYFIVPSVMFSHSLCFDPKFEFITYLWIGDEIIFKSWNDNKYRLHDTYYS